MFDEILERDFIRILGKLTCAKKWSQLFSAGREND